MLKVNKKILSTRAAPIVASSVRAASQHLKAFATVDPENLNERTKGFNLVNGEWTSTQEYINLPDPLKAGQTLMQLPNTSMEEIQPFIDQLKSVPKSGLHNPFKNKERYLLYSEVNRKLVEVMHDPEVFNFFVRCV